MGSIASPEYSRNMSGGNELLETLNANTLFMAQCIIAAVIGGLEFCFPALFVDTFNTFEVYTSHRLYGATMIVNAIIVFAMRKTSDHSVKKEIVQAFLFQFGLHIIVLLRPQVWGFLTPFNKVNLLCSFGLAAAYGYLLMGDKRKISTAFKTQDKLKSTHDKLNSVANEKAMLEATVREQEQRISALTTQLAEARRKGGGK